MTRTRRAHSRTALCAVLLALLAGVPSARSQESEAVPESEAGAEEEEAAAEQSSGESPAAPEQAGHGRGHGDGRSSSRLSDEPRPLAIDDMPSRPRPPLELGNDFLGTGTLHPGFQLPTGAVWQPALIVFGSWRNAVQSVDDGDDRTTELRTRLDLFLNLSLSGTERLVVGVRPLDGDGAFTRYALEGEDEGFTDEIDGELESLFFEGDFGEIFPNLSRDDFSATDIGFSVGRQPLVFQEGVLLGDAVDSIGITRNTLLPSGTSNFRATFLWGWNDLHRLGREDDDAQLFGLFTSTDLRRSTVDVDLAWLSSDGELGDQAFVGASFVQRIGRMSSTFRAVGSFGSGDALLGPGDGGLASAELSWVPHRSHDHVYVNAFAAVDRFTAASRAPGTGGPLAPLGIAFAGSGLGFDGALSSEATDVAGFAVGYQIFRKDDRRQWLFEVAGRAGLDDPVGDAAAASVRFQNALRSHYVLVLDGFAGWRDDPSRPADGFYGARVELVTKF